LATPPKRERKKSLKQAPHAKKATESAPENKGGTLLSAPVDVERSLPASARHERKLSQEPAPQLEGNAASPKRSPRITIFTIGHSTHPIHEFIAILKNYGIEQLVDVRTVPKSRHVPQFNSDALAASLNEQGIAYVHMKALGGLRHAKKDSVNIGWRNASFRGYADYMATEEFAQGIDRLIDLAKVKRTVIMCAEAVPWRCHRSLVGDVLLVRGITAEDIMSATASRAHKLTEFAKVNGQQITYPPDKNLDLFPEAESALE
jgi:hypothetical protein